MTVVVVVLYLVLHKGGNDLGKYASKVIELAQSWIGLKESNKSHKLILDIYNSQRPLPRGYKMKLDDAWCAATVTALAVALDYTDIFPCECSCSKMTAIAKKMGIWVEDESVTPKPGWLIMYDWDDNGVGDNRGSTEHVGVVEAVNGGKFTVIEGNFSNAVKRRTLNINGRYIRGFIAIKYDPESGETVETKPSAPVTTPTTNREVCEVELKQLRIGAEGNTVKALQTLLEGYGYDCGKYHTDGDFGNDTLAAVKRYQKAKKLEVDGIVGKNTWNKLLGNT